MRNFIGTLIAVLIAVFLSIALLVGFLIPNETAPTATLVIQIDTAPGYWVEEHANSADVLFHEGKEIAQANSIVQWQRIEDHLFFETWEQTAFGHSYSTVFCLHLADNFLHCIAENAKIQGAEGNELVLQAGIGAPAFPTTPVNSLRLISQYADEACAVGNEGNLQMIYWEADGEEAGQ